MARIRSAVPRRLALGAAVLAGLLAAGPAIAQTLSVNVQAARTQGVAPLAVLFDASSTVPASASDDAFHDIHYAWDFDDPGSGSWGPSGKPRNQDAGPVVGHVFEDPGTYDVTVRASDRSGRSDTHTVRITVDPASSLQTVCFANDTSDWSDPDGACQGAQRVVTSSFGSVESQIAPGKRLLLRRGDVFDQSGTSRIGGTGPMILGAFGSGTPPQVRIGSRNTSFQLQRVDDWRIMDLRIEGSGIADSTSSTYLFQEVGGTISRLTLLRIDGTGQHNALNMTSKHGVVQPMHDQVAVVDSVFHDFADSNGRGSAVRFDADRSIFAGNQVLDNEDQEFNFRTQHLDTFWIAHNLLDRPKSTKGNMTIRACNWHKSCGGTGNAQTGGTAGVGDTQKFVIADNVIQMRMDGAQVSMNPQNKDSFEVIRQGLIERNLFRGVPGGRGPQKGLKIHASDITVRNNVFDTTHYWSDTRFPGVERTAIFVTRNSNLPIPESTNVRVMNNTHYDGTSWSGGVRMIDSGSGSGHEFVNNLLYAPNHSSPQPVVHRSAGAVRVQANLADRTDYQGNPFVTASPQVPTDFRLAVDSPARDAGVGASVLQDFSGTRRPAGGVWDVGAFEVDTQGGGGAPAAPVLLP